MAEDDKSPPPILIEGPPADNQWVRGNFVEPAATMPEPIQPEPMATVETRPEPPPSTNEE